MPAWGQFAEADAEADDEDADDTRHARLEGLRRPDSASAAATAANCTRRNRERAHAQGSAGDGEDGMAAGCMQQDMLLVSST